jgi:WD40 repeat protein
VSRKVVLGAVAVVGAAAAVAFVFLIVAMVSQGLQQAGALASPLGALASLVVAVAAVVVLVPRKPVVALPPEPKIPVPPEPEAMGWVVGRPAELDAVVNALTGSGAGTVGITTGLHGAGGFGKTTLAKMVCGDRRVREHFGKFVYPMVTVGRDVREAAAIAAKVNDVIKLVAGENATFTDPQLAGARLGSLLDAGPPALLVIDDVWEPEQLAPFLIGGKVCSRLVTTRVPELLPGRSTPVRVDQMSPQQARALLMAGLPQLDEVVVAGLLAVTGRWPLLLRLVSQILADYAQVAVDGAAISAQGEMLLERLAAGGPAVIDEFAGDRRRGLDVGQPTERARAVRATIEASTGLLDGQDKERFNELGVFAEDETIPFSLVARLWRATAGLDELRAAQLCKRLAQLALVSKNSGSAGGIVLHDVIRDFLRAELGGLRLAELNNMLIGALAVGLPVTSPPDRAGGSAVPVVAWWSLGREDQYAWDHLIEHLQEAGRSGEANAIASDLRWVAARIEQSGPAAPVSDLAMAGTPRAARLRGVLMRTAHLLAPSELAGTLVDVLHSRVADDPDWGPQVAALSDSCHRPRLVNRWFLPDLADPALQRVLTGHTRTVHAVAVAPDGSWLASGSSDRTLRIWDTSTWDERAVVTGHGASQAGADAMAVAPDGSWLASGGWDRMVRIWDTSTWDELAVLTGHAKRVAAVAVAPDGSWLASGSWDGTVRIWDTASWDERAVLTGHSKRVTAVAVAADGSWLASGGYDGMVRIWDTSTWIERAVLTGHAKRVMAVAVAPDGSWLAVGGWDGTVRIWDTATWDKRAFLSGHTNMVLAIAVAPDGSWLASGGWDGTVRIWDTATWDEYVVLTGNAGEAGTIATSADGRWLATGNPDGTVRIWNLAIGNEPTVLTGRARRVEAVAAAPDGSWLASGGWDGTVRIWDAATGDERMVLAGHTERVLAVATAPDGSWLASSSWQSNTVRIWDTATWEERAVLTGHTGTVWALAAAPDGSWLASSGLDGTVRIRDTATWDERAVLTGYKDSVWALAVAPDGSWLASGGWDGTVRVWGTAIWDERAVLTSHDRSVMAVVTAADGSWLASGGDDGTLRIWDTATWVERAVLTTRHKTIRALAMAPNGSWLASAGYDGSVWIWDTVTWRAQALMRVDSEIFACAWLSPDALALAGSAGLYLFSFLTGHVDS